MTIKDGSVIITSLWKNSEGFIDMKRPYMISVVWQITIRPKTDDSNNILKESVSVCWQIVY